MATDIVLDDKTGDCIMLNCQEVATSGEVTIDNPASRSAPGGDRVALRHDGRDGLSINPDGGYPDGVTIQRANLNLKVNEQRGLSPKLPARGERGDLLLLLNYGPIPHAADEPERILESCTLWLCVGRATTGAANWAPVPLGAPVAGTV